MSQQISLLDNEVITEVVLASAESKAGKEYKYLSLVFNNGFEQRVYLDRAVLFMVETLSDQK